MSRPGRISAVRWRWKRCEDIAIAARLLGMDVSPLQVNLKYYAWTRWYEGRLDTRCLQRITGINLRRTA